MPYFAYASEGIDHDCVHKTEKISKVTNRIVQAMDVLDFQSIHVDITQDYTLNLIVLYIKIKYGLI
jgi:hypothetical protein